MESFLERLLIAKLKLRMSKCRLLQREEHFLGRVVSEAGICVDPAKVEAVTSWAVPHNLKEVCAPGIGNSSRASRRSRLPCTI